MKIRKIVATTTVASLFFMAPSVIPVKAGIAPCGVAITWTTADSAFAFPAPIPCPTFAAPTPWIAILVGAGAGSVILNAIIVSNTQCRELTQQETILSIFLPFLGIAMDQQINKCPH
jgi:hypothetical protein